MTIALTGATGFVGQAVLDQAAQSDETVRALTRRAQAPRANVEWVAGDLSDTAALAALCEPCDAIVHVAGLTNAPDPAAFEEANVGGTARLIAAARHSRAKRFVFKRGFHRPVLLLKRFEHFCFLLEPFLVGASWVV